MGAGPVASCGGVCAAGAGVVSERCCVLVIGFGAVSHCETIVAAGLSGFTTCCGVRTRGHSRRGRVASDGAGRRGGGCSHCEQSDARGAVDETR